MCAFRLTLRGARTYSQNQVTVAGAHMHVSSPPALLSNTAFLIAPKNRSILRTGTATGWGFWIGCKIGWDDRKPHHYPNINNRYG
jgi:hypothetical protein